MKQDFPSNEPRMTSLEIAEVTGKQHKNVMQAIRNMEPAWQKTCGLKFQLTSFAVKMPNGGEQKRSCYSLTKTECLYVATKFNDEARARLVLRWKELEEQAQRPHEMSDIEILSRAVLISDRQIKALTQQNTTLALTVQTLKPKADYTDNVLQSVDCLTTTQVAKSIGMTGPELYRALMAMHIIYHQSGQYMLYAEYARRGYAATRTYTWTDLFGIIHTRSYLVWTEAGAEFIRCIDWNS